MAAGDMIAPLLHQQHVDLLEQRDNVDDDLVQLTCGFPPVPLAADTNVVGSDCHRGAQGGAGAGCHELRRQAATLCRGKKWC